MDWTEIRENWEATIPSLQSRWPEVPEEDWIAAAGERADIAAAIARWTGNDLTEAERDLEEWREGPMPADAYADPTHDDEATRDARRYIPEGEDPLADDSRFGDDDVPDRPIGRRDD